MLLKEGTYACKFKQVLPPPKKKKKKKKKKMKLFPDYSFYI